MEEGRLYYIGNQEKRPGVKQPTDVRRIVVESEEEQRKKIRLIHDEAHLGKGIRDTFCNVTFEHTL